MQLKTWCISLAMISSLATGIAFAADDAAKPAEPAKEAAAAPAASDKTKEITELMTQKGYLCLACHKVDEKAVGPAYKDVAAKYKDDPKAAEALAGKVKAGSKGVWGDAAQSVMPPNPTVTDEDMKAIISWILSLK